MSLPISPILSHRSHHQNLIVNMEVEAYLIELESSTREALSLARSCTEKQLAYRPEGKWSVLQILEHICLSDAIMIRVIGRPTTTVSEHAELVGDSKLRTTVAQGRAYKITAPEALTPLGAFANIAEFESVFVRQVDEFKHDLTSGKILIDNRTFTHRYFGEMTITDWMNFVIHHTTRHLEQIRELNRECDALAK